MCYSTYTYSCSDFAEQATLRASLQERKGGGWELWMVSLILAHCKGLASETSTRPMQATGGCCDHINETLSTDIGTCHTQAKLKKKHRQE